MNIFQATNHAATFLIYAALVGGAVTAISADATTVRSLIENNLDGLFLFMFIAVFNLKSYADDHKHFGELYQRDELWERSLGFVLAVFSWLFMALAAAFIFDLQKCAELLWISLLISTFWIVAHLVEILRDRSRKTIVIQKLIKAMRQKWFAINVIYLVVLGMYVGVPEIRSEDYKWAYTLFLFLVLVFDTATSESFRGLVPKRVRKKSSAS